jgi:hypothetical protein
MALVGRQHDERRQRHDREERSGGQEAAPERVDDGERVGGQERDDPAGVADGEPGGRDAAELLGRRDAGQIRIVVDDRRLVGDNAHHRQHPAPQGHPRPYRRHQSRRGDADYREADEEALARPGVVGDAAEQGRGERADDHGGRDGRSPQEIAAAGRVADD